MIREYGRDVDPYQVVGHAYRAVREERELVSPSPRMR
jgi:hypothetical protein